MSVREATEDDVPYVASLVRGLAEFESMAEDVVGTEADLRRALFGPDPVARVTLAVDDERRVTAGYALWFPTYSTFRGRPGIWLEDLFVGAPFRRCGHARALLDDLRQRAEGRVEWQVLDWNRGAMAFYEGLGASPVKGWTTYRWS